jgi:hypothetical protein
MQQMFVYCRSYCLLNMFRSPYAHHQELESVIQLVAACGIWCLVFKLSVWFGAEGYVSSSPQNEHITLSCTPYRQLENLWNTDGHNGARNMLSKQ